MERKIRVLFLPKWYPNRYDPMPGLFIQRQAEAITPFCDVALIYVHPDPHCPNKMEVEFSEENEVRVLRVYFKVSEGQSSLAGKALNLWRFYQAHRKAFHSIREFSPELVHAHILTRMGFIGWQTARKQHIPVIISEHWSRYFPENNTYQGWFRKLVTGFVVKRASVVVAVSEPLRLAMLRCGLNNPDFRVIPNVVDSVQMIVSSGTEKSEIKRMVHISCFEDKSKNISGFLRSVKALSLLRQDFVCVMVGAGPDWEDMKEYAGYLRILDSFVHFTGVKTGVEFVEILNTADFSVMSSRYETFGTVVIESLACGIPVVATGVGVAREEINGGNGLLVPPGDEKAMTDAIYQMLNLCREYDKEAIKAGILNKYTREIVGQQLTGLYREILSTPGWQSRKPYFTAKTQRG
ncbi:MAG: glycosyltransferase [Bacteroidetes bacterium]|nr:glycosyltransferase [Bacteroidota bacterium]